MAKITEIKPQQNPERVSIFIDNEFALGTKKVVAEILNLELGQDWTKEKLKEASDKELQQIPDLNPDKEAIITKIDTETTKNKVNIYLENEFAIGIEKDLFNSLKIEIGEIWTINKLKTLKKEKEEELKKIHNNTEYPITSIKSQKEDKAKINIYLNEKLGIVATKEIIEALNLEIGQTWTVNKLKTLKKEKQKEIDSTKECLISDIKPQSENPEKIVIYLDGQKGIGTSKKVLEALNLEIGQKWTKESLKQENRKKQKELKAVDSTKEYSITNILPYKSDVEKINIYLNDKRAVTTTDKIIEALNLEIGQKWTKETLQQAVKEIATKIEYKLTKIEPQKNDPKRVSIYLNNEYTLGTTKEVSEILKLEIGQIWTTENLKQEAEKISYTEEKAITTISPQKNNPQRISIFLDGHFAIGIDKELAESAQLELGQIWSKEKLNQLK
ncbi:MAG: hypothetical protein ACRCVG_04615 [Methanobacteriaceae archaeon]